VARVNVIKICLLIKVVFDGVQVLLIDTDDKCQRNALVMLVRVKDYKP
jgi:hypothetical protein